MNKKSTDNIIESAKGSFSFAILRGGIRIGKTKKNVVLKKEIAVFVVVKFSTIITLYKMNG